MEKYDQRALQVAAAVRDREQPELTILFGSRARGDHDSARSDIDILLVQESEPGPGAKQAARMAAITAAEESYGRPVPVDLVWRTLDRFRHNRRYVNSVETNAVREGVVMPRNPEDYGSGRYEDEQSGYEYDWSNYRERLRHAEAHLDALVSTAEAGLDDLVIGQQAQNALEHGLKALIEAAGGKYANTHNISHLLGAARHSDTGMRDFRLSIPPDVYTEYEGTAEYEARRQPELTRFPDYLERTTADAARIIARAKELYGQARGE